MAGKTLSTTTVGWRRTGQVIGAAAAAILFGNGAEAQTVPVTGETFAAPARKLDISVAGESMYDSNVARGRSNAATLRGVKPEDVRLSPTVNVDIALPVGPAEFSLSGVAGYDFFVRNSQLNRERIDLTGAVAVNVRPCALNIDGGFARRQTDLVDLSINPTDPVASSVNVQTSKRIGATVSCGATVGFRPTASVTYTRANNSAPQRDLQNFDSWTYSGGLAYSSPAFGIVTAFVSHTKSNYDQRNVPGAPIGTPEFGVTSVGISLDRRLGARLQVRGQISYANVDLPAGFSSGEGDGINWDVSASLRVGSRALVSLGTGRYIDSTLGFNSNFAKTSTYLATVEYALTQRLRLSIFETHRNRDFQVTLLRPALLLTHDSFDEAGARLSYIRRRYTVTLSPSYQRRNADVSIYDYDSWRVSLGISIKLGR